MIITLGTNRIESKTSGKYFFEERLNVTSVFDLNAINQIFHHFSVRGIPQDRLSGTVTSSNRAWDRQNEEMTSLSESSGWNNTERPQPVARLGQVRTGAGSTLSSRFQSINRQHNEGFG